MGARLRIFLTPAEDRELFEMRKAANVPQRVKDRAEAVRLNNQGWYVEKIAAYLGWSLDSVRDTLHRWQRGGIEGLWEAKGRGAQASWDEEDMAYLENCLRQDERTYNSQQLAEKLAEEREVKLSADHLRRILKKRG